MHGKRSGKLKFFQVREKSGKFGLIQGNWQKMEKVREFQNFVKTEMSKAVLRISETDKFTEWFSLL